MSTNTQTLLIHALYAAIGVFLTSVAQSVGDFQLGTWAPIITAVLTALTAFIHKQMSDSTPPAPPAPPVAK